MSIIKLIPGQRIAFGVGGTEIVEGNYGPQIKFSGATPDDGSAVLFLNVEPATRQLERIGLTVDSVVGQKLEIERVEKNGTKYTNIYKANSGNAHMAAPVQAKPAAPSNAKQPLSSGGPLPWEQEETGAPPADAFPHEKLDHLFRVYSIIEDHVLATSVQKFTKAQVGSSPESVAAQIATLLIAAQKAGV